MNRSTIYLNPKFAISVVDPRIFGGFLEHMGRAVYEGVYQPESVHADADGLRRDVLDALRGLDMTIMRYPGGNFASGYHWQDGIGPRDQRPVLRELAWQSIEPNQFGTDEFLALCRQMNWSPMLTVNLGTGTPEEARNWVEYCNMPTGTRYADMRAANGHPEPYGVRTWCLGNEMDGPWQLGHVPADQYAIRAQQAAKLMRDTDPTIETIACGSSGPLMPTYGEWDRTVLEYVGDLADYISLHRYVGNHQDDTPDYLAVTNSIDTQIEGIDAICQGVQAKRKSAKRAYLSFDEWNVWYKALGDEHVNGKGKFAPHLIEEVYNLEDALVAAGFLHSFIRHADSVKIANIAQIVNVIAPILTRGDDMLIQSIYYPFAMMARRRTGTALQTVVDGPRYTGATHGEVSVLDTSAILDGDTLHVFVTNRSVTEAAPVTLAPSGTSLAALTSAELVTGPGPKAANSYENPKVIQFGAFDAVKIADGAASFELPPLSFAALSFRLG